MLLGDSLKLTDRLNTYLNCKVATGSEKNKLGISMHVFIVICSLLRNIMRAIGYYGCTKNNSFEL